MDAPFCPSSISAENDPITTKNRYSLTSLRSFGFAGVANINNLKRWLAFKGSTFIGMTHDLRSDSQNKDA